MNMQTKNLDHLGLVAGICEQIQLVEQIDAFFPNPLRKVTVGEATKAMILNALGFVSKPMYLTVDFFRNKAVDALFRPTLQAEDFNDDTLGRALDALFEENPTTIFAQVASHALRTAGIDGVFVGRKRSAKKAGREWRKPARPKRKTNAKHHDEADISNV